MPSYRLGVDVGGTFTDFVLIRDGEEILLYKRLSTPDDPSRGVLAGLREMCELHHFSPADLTHIVHGTTVVANALIERKGDRTALITTEGFHDVLEIGREVRYDIYDLGIENPEPLVPRHLRFGLAERTMADGSVRSKPQPDDIVKLAGQLVDEGVRSVAVCLIHAQSNPANEQAVATILREQAPDLHLTLSSEIAPEIREYERMATTVANAYVHPLVNQYLLKLEEDFAAMGFSGRFLVMLSHGGVAAISLARNKPVQLVESGPAAGAHACGFVGERIGLNELVAFDMGGTTAKACVVEQGEPAYTTETEVARIHRFKKGSGMPLKVPSVDMIEIGAGGGSIRRLGHIGMVKVGPESAGSQPGPACYALGGTDPTVTDANLVLGFLNADSFLGGSMLLDKQRAENALLSLAGPLSLEPVDVAAGIIQLTNENMATAARLYMAERGKDPQRHTLMAFGGGGPVHGYRVARALRMKRVVYPMGAGVFSALGFLVTAPAAKLVRSYVVSLHEMDWRHLDNLVDEMSTQTRALLAEAGVSDCDIELTLTSEMRYVGQGHEVAVEVPLSLLRAKDVKGLRARFESAYEELFSMTLDELGVQAINWRLSAKGPGMGAPIEHWGSPSVGDDITHAQTGERAIYLADSRTFANVPVYDRYRLQRGMSFVGPALVVERESTIVIDGPGHCVIDDFSNLVLSI